ncbi:MAG: hypothetical protein Q8868_12815 [Bacteroidota bacterium]|nr:hypothetical protein [Bacteroidota bacterium]
MMENNDIDKLTRNLMADSMMNLDDSSFDNRVMQKILIEADKKDQRRFYLSNILLLFIIGTVIFSLLWLSLLDPQVNSFWVSVANSLLSAFRAAGAFILQYDYLIISFLFVGILNLIIKSVGWLNRTTGN